MKICFVKLSALGDVVMMLPFIRTLQKSFPDAELFWVISKAFYPIVRELKGVNFIAVDKIRSYKTFWEARRTFKEKRFDFLLGMQASLSAHLFYPLISADRRIGRPHDRSKDLHSLLFKERVARNPFHTVDLCLEFARYIGAKDISKEGEIPLTEEEKEFSVISDPYYVIHPCSSRSIRDWPIDRYIDLGCRLYKKYGLTLLLTGAVKDREITQEIACKVPSAIDLAGKTCLRKMAAILSKAEFLISPDTGPLHIASAFKRKVFGLYATSSSIWTGPYYSMETVIDKHEEVKRLFGVQKKKFSYSRLYHEKAMQLIATQEVVEKIDKHYIPSCV